MPYYALGLKGWVEIRYARRPPSPHLSEVKYRCKEGGQHPLFTWDTLPAVTISLKQISFTGGKFITSFSRRKFTARTRLSVPFGTVLKLSKQMEETILPLNPKGGEDGQSHSPAAIEAAADQSTAGTSTHPDRSA